MNYIVKILYISIITASCHLSAQTVAIPDTNFRSFLKISYPEILDVNENLITTKAALIRGSLICENQNIEDLEGIQYFTGLSNLNVCNNRIHQLPDLSALKQLKTLWACKNLLETLPELSSLTQLQELAVYENKISALPSLSQLVQLNYLDVASNNLKALPDLKHCTKLNRLFCNYNQLVTLPNTDSLLSLVALDASHNKLSSFPDLSKNLSLETVNLNDNLLKILTELPYWPKIKKIWLFNNYLDFKELEKLKVYPNYKTLFQIAPQYSIPFEKTIFRKEWHPVAFSSHADTTLAKLEYKWFKNGTTLTSNNTSSYTIDQVTFADSGIYKCEIRHSDFPFVVLTTSINTLKVQACIPAKAFTHQTSEITCEQSGILRIIAPDSDTYYYTLTAQQSGRTWESGTGLFEMLQEAEYKLNISTNQCPTVRYPSTILLFKQSCSKALITPNGDDNQDQYFFEEKGSVKIFNKRGELIKTLTGPTYWDATSDTGLVPQGIYIVNINEGAKMISISVVY